MKEQDYQRQIAVLGVLMRIKIDTLKTLRRVEGPDLEGLIDELADHCWALDELMQGRIVEAILPRDERLARFRARRSATHQQGGHQP